MQCVSNALSIVNVRKMDPITPIAQRCHTYYSQHTVDKYENFCRPVTVTVQVYISTEMKPSFNATQNECGVNISTYTAKGVSSQHSFLLHDEHPGVCEEQLCYIRMQLYSILWQKQ